MSESEALIARVVQKEEQRNVVGQGKKYDGNKAAPELLSPFALTVCARILAKGARKYASRNWELGFAWSRSIAAILRHLFRYMMGQTHDIGEKKYGDKEDCADCAKGTLDSMDWVCLNHTGESHAGNVMVNASFLLHFEKTKPELDDRPKYEIK